jgi:hypothetical protein
VASATNLIELAKGKFDPLSRAEEKLFTDAQTGEEASALTGDEAKDDPADAAKWGDERALRAECIVWLCTTPEASALVTHRGIRISGMRIDGDIDLTDAQVPFPLYAPKCAFSGKILLRAARLRSLHLVATHVTRYLAAYGAKIEGDVSLSDGFRGECAS